MKSIMNIYRQRLIGIVLTGLIIAIQYGYSQSPSFKTYMNPVIPGDHPDCTLTQIGDDFYTTGSSFNPTPVIYHSTDLVHWEAIAQPVSAAWTGYGDKPGGGCWGGHLVYHNNKFWHFFFRGTMYFVTANAPEGPWSMPTVMICPSSVPGLGYDNSIFIDDDNKWYLVIKNGQVNNWIVELGANGQPAGAIYDLRWINPAPTYPYSWAEGPVMWKYNGYYYYSFGLNVAGGQKVMRSSILTDDSNAWTMLGDFFNLSDPKRPQALFGNPNHNSAPVLLNDSTSWVIHPVYYAAGGDWDGQGRQGLLNQVRYDTSSIPLADYPINEPYPAPKLSSSGIPWMVPKSDFFSTTVLNPEWSFSGYTPTSSYSLTARPGWLKLTPRSNKSNTVFKNDGEHNYSLTTKLDFDAKASGDEAGLRISTAADTIFVKVFSSFNASGNKVICFSFYKTYYELPNNIGDTLWLKLNRINHIISGFYSSNGVDWVQIGQSVDVTLIDSNADMKNWSGQRQGLYVLGNQSAYFDLYIYRDAYSLISADCPANQYGTTRGYGILDNINNNDWALYAGVEFQNIEYGKIVDSIKFLAATAAVGGNIEVWLDSIDTGEKIGTCKIDGTGSWVAYKTFTTKVNQVSGRHDVYLKFTGIGTSNLFRLKSMQFTFKKAPKYLHSETTSDTTIMVYIDQRVATPISSAGFAITFNSTENISIMNVSLGISDSLIILTLSKKINPTDIIEISYKEGDIRNSDGLELNPFANNLVNNLVTVKVDKYDPVSNAITIYPVPVKNSLSIVSDFQFNTISVFDLKGEIVFKKEFHKSINKTEIQLNVVKGVYILKLVSKSQTAYSRFLVE